MKEIKYKYVGLTIGPIYKTFSNVRHTRELWAASFCFSFLMRTILKKMADRTSKECVIQPFVDDMSLFDVQGIGLFPDRIILKLENNAVLQIEDIISESIAELAGHISLYLDIAADIKDVIDFLTDYFQISFFEKVSDAIDNPIIELSPYLDALEQFTKYSSKEKERNYLKEFFKNVNKGDAMESFLKKHYEISDINGNIRVESLIEIATRELKGESDYVRLINEFLWDKEKKKDRENNKKSKESTDSLFLNNFTKCLRDKYKDKTPFKTYHKYICILKADGDKIGSYLKSLNANDVQQLSTKLMNWAKATYKHVCDYGGVPTFIGGDDLLCIVPVANKDKNIFDLIQEIDDAFNKQFKDTPATLSYGVSISHYKYPLSESLDIVDGLLGSAKEKGGNRIALQLLKHSGRELMTVIDKNHEVYTKTIRGQLIKLLSSPMDEENLKNVINNAVMYKIRDNHELLETIIDAPVRLVNFFNNNFDVKAVMDENYDKIPGHLDEKTNLPFYDDPFKEQYFYCMKEMVNKIFESKKKELVNENLKRLTQETIREVFSIFRNVKFIKGYEDDKE